MKTILFIFTLCFSVNVIAQCAYQTNVPKEFYRNRYQPADAVTTRPFTLFNKTKPNWNLEEDLNKIRYNIISGEADISKDKEDFKNNFTRLYYEIYKNAISPEPSKCAIDQEECPHPIWVKNNAVVNLIGIVVTETPTTITFKYAGPGDPDRHIIDYHGWLAEEGLRNLNPEVPTCINITSYGCDKPSKVALSLLYYLQAYDMLKASGRLPQFDWDRNTGDCSARNKLREFTRNLFIQSNGVINSTFGYKKNHGIICASVLGVAAMVLWDAGTGLASDVPLLAHLNPFVLFSRIFSPPPRPNYNPQKWMNRCLGKGQQPITTNVINLVGYFFHPVTKVAVTIDLIDNNEDGLEDNIFKGHRIFSSNVPMTSPDGKAGYAEGPGYAQYAFRALLPFLRTQANFHSDDNNWLLKDNRYKEVLNWAFNIQSFAELNPTYDNTHAYSTNLLGIMGEADWPGTPAALDIAYYADYLFANGATPNATIPSPGEKLTQQYVNSASGNAIMRALDDNGHSHYAQLLAEKDYAVDEWFYIPFNLGFTPTHEDYDAGSFTIMADNQQLAIDPPYMRWGTHHLTNKRYHHNILRVDDTEFAGVATDFMAQPNAVEVKLSTVSAGQVDNLRLLKSYKTAGKVYYLLEDRCLKEDGNNSSFNLLINGNGRDVENSFVQTNHPNSDVQVVGGRIFKWWHPCNIQTQPYKWGLLAHSAIMNTSSSNSFANYTSGDYVHGSAGGYITNSLGFKDRTKHIGGIVPYAFGQSPADYGEHNRMHITVENTKVALFQTLLLPYRCNLDTMPNITRVEDTNSVTTIVRFPYLLDTAVSFPAIYKTAPLYTADVINDIHTAQMNNQTITIVDTEANLSLTTNAKYAFASYGNLELLRVGACAPSITKFKKAEINNGTDLIISGKKIINATANSSAFYERIGKLKYEGFVKTESFMSITFLIPDAEFGVKLKATQGMNKLTSNHYYQVSTNDSFQLIKIDFTPGLTKFIIELDDPCLANCFFPPTHQPIDTLLYFDNGGLETLGHDLDIVQSKGEFHIIKGSKMSICPEFVFNNKDSLILYAIDEGPAYPFANQMDGPTTVNAVVRERTVGKRSMIIVNEKAALVLDSGSFTHVGDNATILVLKGGTLLIRKGAVVEIGGNESLNNKAFGEIIAEEGAFVCIEDSSTIYFFKDSLSNDSIDNNVFYVSLNKQNPTIAGTNPLAGRGKFTATPDAVGIYSNTNCLNFCDIKNVMPPYGIQNRDWGWCNFSRPKIKQIVPPFICTSTNLYLNPHKVLNETWFKIAIEKNGIKVFEKLSTDDSIRFSGLRLPALQKNENYTLKIFILNDCNEGDTLIQSISIPDLPQPNFTIPKTGCEGIENILADGRLSINNHAGAMDYIWFAQKLNSHVDGNDTFYLADDDYLMEWLYTNKNVVDSAFNFTGFKWEGGHKYVVGLTIKGICFDNTVYDTISIPFGVQVTAEALLTTNQLLGKPSIQLNGTATQPITTFTWSNPAKLINSNTLTPQTNTTDSVTTYVLTASNGVCSATDTIHIKYNNYLFMGNDTITCKGTALMLGNKMEESLLFGLLGAIDYNTFNNYFDNYLNADPLFTKKFGLALLANNHYLWLKLKSNHKEFFGIIESHKDSFYRNPNYIEVYNQYVTTSLKSYMDYFSNDFLNNNPNLKMLILKVVNNYNNVYGTMAFENLLVSTFDNLMRDFQTYNNPLGNISWFANGIEQAALQGQLLTNLTYDTTTRLGMLVNIDNILEYDDVLVLVDSTIYPSFSIGYMHDSTVYFSAIPNAPAHLNYLWQFGDSSTSTLKNPIHTFPQFNNWYYVCLTVYNQCNQYTFCDTLTVDTNLSNLFHLGKRSITTQPKVEPQQSLPTQNIVVKTKGVFLGNNIPNPFDESTTIEYEVNEPANDLRLIVTNSLGQQKLNVQLIQTKGTVSIHKDNLDKGVYYYYLSINGVNTPAKLMLVK